MDFIKLCCKAQNISITISLYTQSCFRDYSYQDGMIIFLVNFFVEQILKLFYTGLFGVISLLLFITQLNYIFPPYPNICHVLKCQILLCGVMHFNFTRFRFRPFKFLGLISSQCPSALSQRFCTPNTRLSRTK